MPEGLVIYEEETNLIWGMIVIVATAFATYLLGDAFINRSMFNLGFRQLLALALFLISFIGILKITDPLYQFKLTVENRELVIKVYKGDDLIKTLNHNLDEIAEIRFAPHSPSLQDEALFNFSTNYHLIFRYSHSTEYQKLIDLGNVTFTLKVPDIVKIIRFLRERNPDIDIPEHQRSFMD